MLLLACAAGCDRSPPPAPRASTSQLAAPAQPPSAPPAASSAPAPQKAAKLPENLSVILITLDSMRADMPWAGYPRQIAPTLTALEKESVSYTRAYALSSYTSMSLGGALAGNYPGAVKRDGYFFGTYPKDVTMFPERLQAAGVRTMAVQGHGYFKPGTGLSQGFDEWKIVPNLKWNAQTDENVTSPQMLALSEELLSREENTRGRFFFWVHFLDPHDQYMPHKDGTAWGKKARDLYDGEIEFTDKHVKQLLEFVAKQPWASRVAIVVSADHGESFGEHGVYRHGFEIYENLVRVPWFFRVPGVTPRRVEHARSHLDLAPTMLELLGAPADPALPGQSLVPELLGEVTPGARDVIVDLPRTSDNDRRRALITGSHKIISYGDDAYQQVYDVVADPDEKVDLAKTDKALHKALLEKYKAATASIRDVKPYACQKLKGTKDNPLRRPRGERGDDDTRDHHPRACRLGPRRRLAEPRGGDRDRAERLAGRHERDDRRRHAAARRPLHERVTDERRAEREQGDHHPRARGDLGDGRVDHHARDREQRAGERIDDGDVSGGRQRTRRRPGRPQVESIERDRDDHEQVTRERVTPAARAPRDDHGAEGREPDAERLSAGRAHPMPRPRGQHDGDRLERHERDGRRQAGALEADEEEPEMEREQRARPERARDAARGGPRELADDRARTRRGEHERGERAPPPGDEQRVGRRREARERAAPRERERRHRDRDERPRRAHLDADPNTVSAPAASVGEARSAGVPAARGLCSARLSNARSFVAAIATVALSASALAACAPPKVTLVEGPREYVPFDYDQILRRWTRSGSLVALAELDDLLSVTTTFESWDFRWAYAVRYADDYRLTMEQRRELLERSLRETREQHRFYVTLHGPNRRWNELTKRSSAWVLRLVDSEGNETAPARIEAVRKPGAVERTYFPYTNIWRQAFRVSFPVKRDDGRPTIDPGSSSFGLRFAGALGHQDLTWQLAPGGAQAREIAAGGPPNVAAPTM